MKVRKSELLKALLLSYAAVLFFTSPTYAWNDHKIITKLSLYAYENWDKVQFEPPLEVFSKLKFQSKELHSKEELCAALNIRCEKLEWEWMSDQPNSEIPAIDVIIKAVREPDDGMDQELHISDDQKYMGGFTGLGSQAIRHMYYRKWTPIDPIISFHYPVHEMGFAPERAKYFFEIAIELKKRKHMFWAYRALGWGLHYVQDIAQPYHSTQFGSTKLLPLLHLLTKGWTPFIDETTRLVSNFHLSFENFADLKLVNAMQSNISNAFKVPNGDVELQNSLELKGAEINIDDAVKALAASSSRLAPEIIEVQKECFGKSLFDSSVDIGKTILNSPDSVLNILRTGMTDSTKQDELKKLDEILIKALSNTSVVTRWYIDRFKNFATE